MIGFDLLGCRWDVERTTLGLDWNVPWKRPNVLSSRIIGRFVVHTQRLQGSALRYKTYYKLRVFGMFLCSPYLFPRDRPGEPCGSVGRGKYCSDLCAAHCHRELSAGRRRAAAHPATSSKLCAIARCFDLRMRGAETNLNVALWREPERGGIDTNSYRRLQHLLPTIIWLSLPIVLYSLQSTRQILYFLCSSPHRWCSARAPCLLVAVSFHPAYRRRAPSNR